MADYSGTAELARRRYELAKGRAESGLAQSLGNIGRQYYGQARQLEGGLEARGILRSGEANRRRVELGAEEKAARLAQQQAAEQDVQSAALDYASVLAEIQAKGGTTGTTPEPEKPKEPEPVITSPGRTTTPTPTPTPTPPAGGGGGAPVTQPTVTECGPGYYWDPVQRACVPISSGGPVQPGMPSLAPGQGGINEIGSGGRPFGTPPTPSQGPVLAPGQGGINEVGSGGRAIGAPPTTSIATPAPNGMATIGGVTLPSSVWNAFFGLGQAQAAAQPRTPAPTPAPSYARAGGLRIG